MGETDSPIAQAITDGEEEVRRLLAALQATLAVLAAAAPNPIELYLVSEELRTTRRQCEATLRDIQEQLDLRLDELGDTGRAAPRQSGMLARTVRRSVAG